MNSVGHTAGLKDWRTRLHYYWLLVRADRPIGIFLLLEALGAFGKENKNIEPSVSGDD